MALKIRKAPLAIAIFIAYVCATLVLPPCYDRQSYLAAIIDKHRILEQAHSPKIVFVGGSNLALGLDSKLISREMGVDVVNMGLSRLFGLRYSLEEVKDCLHQGDTVVIVPEYENFFGEMNGSAYLMNVPVLMPRSLVWIWRSYSDSPQRISELGWHFYQSLNFKWTWWRNLANQVAQGHLINPYLSAINPSEPFKRARHDFTDNGDFVGHLKLKAPDRKYLVLLANLKRNIDPNACKVINSFDQFARTRGVSVVLLPPPLPQPLYDQNRELLTELYGYWQKNLSVPVLASPDRYTFSKQDFFNSLYHLNKNAREERTAMVVQDLKEHMSVAYSGKKPN